MNEPNDLWLFVGFWVVAIAIVAAVVIWTL